MIEMRISQRKKKTSYDIEAKNKILAAQDRQKSYVAEI